ncbi:MAG: symmetrical bis(5'-nucleosyl)-tetraphosphatase [Gammaproteobacteria bacterium]|nr:symmetrical bis(5'-nucleosyl)-tetraphosphatase [Gammaproteobacteria bacterium]
MATYAIGDIQGCYQQLMELLDKLNFDQTEDTLWFAGDLVNRGPNSLQTLRFVKGLGKQAVTVLGNHDLHLLAVANKHFSKHPFDSLDDITNAPDRDELLDWIRERPLLHHDEALDLTMIHAGLPPQWDLTTAQQCANEVEKTLRGDQFQDFLAHMYGNEPGQWSDSLQGWDRLRFITNCFSRLRYCDTQGNLCLQAKGPPGTQPEPYIPWFNVPDRASKDMKIIFGHWSTLGLQHTNGIYALDTGCLWGHQLTAMRLDNIAHLDIPEFISIDCPEIRPIDKA